MATGSEATDDRGVRRTDNHFLEHAGLAYFWLSKEESKDVKKRVFQGELELVKTLKPSFKFPNLTVRVSTIVSLEIVDEIYVEMMKVYAGAFAF